MEAFGFFILMSTFLIVSTYAEVCEKQRAHEIAILKMNCSIAATK